MPLKVKTQTVHVVDDTELERLANEVYGRELQGGSPRRFYNPYEFAAVGECGNDTDHAFVVSARPHPDDQLAVDSIRGGVAVPMYRNGLLLDLLCADGHIAPGNYLIQVSW